MHSGVHIQFFFSQKTLYRKSTRVTSECAHYQSPWSGWPKWNAAISNVMNSTRAFPAWTGQNVDGWKLHWVHVCVCLSDGHVFWELYLLIRVDFKCICSSNISITLYGVNYVDILRAVCKTTGINNRPDMFCGNVMAHNTAHLHTFSCRCQHSFNIFLIHTGCRGESSE